MRNLTPIRVLAMILSMPVAFTVGASLAAQPAPANKSELIPVTVTDPLNRLVTGLDREHFTILEGGIPRSIVDFSSPDAPIAIAIISQSPVTFLAGLFHSEDELIQTSSV